LKPRTIEHALQERQRLALNFLFKEGSIGVCWSELNIYFILNHLDSVFDVVIEGIDIFGIKKHHFTILDGHHIISLPLEGYSLGSNIDGVDGQSDRNGTPVPANQNLFWVQAVYYQQSPGPFDFFFEDLGGCFHEVQGVILHVY